jgi:hypothetical protein
MRSIIVPLELTVRLVAEGTVDCAALACKPAQLLEDCIGLSFICIVVF